MKTEFILKQRRNHGKVAKHHVSARGFLVVGEVQCPTRRRLVLTASFERTDGGPPIPPLRDAVLRAATQTGTQSISGVEELTDGPLMDPQTFGQSWQLTPVAYDDLREAEQNLGRLMYRLSQLGVNVRMLPGGGMVIPGETRPDDGEPVGPH